MVTSRTNKMDELPTPSSSSSQSRKRPPESLGRQHHNQIPSNNYNYSNSNNKSYETTSSQSSGEKTREDVNIHYQYNNKNSQQATTTTAPSTPAYQQGGDFNDDQQIIERALQESKLQYKMEQQQRSNCENEQLERAKRESLATAPSLSNHHHRQQQQQQQHRQQHQQLNDDIILIDDSDDDDDDRKLSAKQSTDSAKVDLKMPTNNNNSQDCRDDDLERAITLSLEEQSKPKQEHEFQQSSICCRVFSREEFGHTLNSLIDKNDGFEKIEKGKLVKEGNKSGDVKSSTKQSRAQYGRYMTEHMWQVFDVLEGKISPQDTKAVAAACKEDKDEQNEAHSRLGSKITAFVDIGHGIGIQVMMAAWSLNVSARGIELMEERNEIAKILRDGIIDEGKLLHVC